uniref:glutathione transferase n=1 Tax=Anser cygnoides TaxID=8845 RepID=A0A8B9DVS7_ANSCY
MGPGGVRAPPAPPSPPETQTEGLCPGGGGTQLPAPPGGGTARPHPPALPAAPDYDKSQWINEKEKLGLDFPNEKLKPGYLEQLPGKLKLFSNFLGDRKWFAGDKLTFVDFLMFDVLDQNSIFEPKCLEPYKNLKDFMDRFGALEKVAAYMKSSRFQKMPINNKMAKWGNKKE